MVLENILPRKRLKEIDESEETLKHLAINLADVYFLEQEYEKKQDESLAHIDKMLEKRNFLIGELLDLQIKNSIPIMTILVSSSTDKPKFINQIYDKLGKLLQDLESDKRISENKIRVSIFGKWYDISGSTISKVRSILESTKDNDQLFLNIFINYDGQDEIVDACKSLSHKSRLGKLEPNQISKNILDESMYFAQLSKPKRVIHVNKRKRTMSFLLWEAAHSKTYFVEKHWNEITGRDLEKYFTKN